MGFCQNTYVSGSNNTVPRDALASWCGVRCGQVETSTSDARDDKMEASETDNSSDEPPARNCHLAGTPGLPIGNDDSCVILPGVGQTMRPLIVSQIDPERIIFVQSHIRRWLTVKALHAADFKRVPKCLECGRRLHGFAGANELCPYHPTSAHVQAWWHPTRSHKRRDG